MRKQKDIAEHIHKTEQHIDEGKFIKADTSMTDEEIDDLLMK